MLTEQFAINAINRFGYIAVMLLIALENIFPPIPSEVILTFSGFMAANSKLKLWLVIAYATLGSLLGALTLYWVGAYIKPETAKKWGKKLCFNEKQIKKTAGFFKSNGGKAVLFARFLPIVRSLISIPAGMNKMPYYKFVSLTVLGTGVWNTALTVAGAAAGKYKDYIVYCLSRFSVAFFVVIVIILLVIFIKNFKYNRQK